MRHTDIIDTIEAVAPPRLQEDYDNTGWQCGNPCSETTGCTLCVDLTEDIVHEAQGRGHNLIITHHPLLFRATKSLSSPTRVNRALTAAIRADIAVYSCHTSVDNAPQGVSHAMGKMLGLQDCTPLAPLADPALPGAGMGLIGDLPRPLTTSQMIELVKSTFHSPVARCSDPSEAPQSSISRVALCGGAGSDLIPLAVKAGAQAFITSDTKYNLFLDHARDILIIDIGHWESEECSKGIFFSVIKKKFPNFAVEYSKIERNPINYL